MQVRKQQLELDMKQQTGSKLEKGYVCQGEQRGQGASLMLRSTSKGHEGDLDIKFQAAVSPGEGNEGALGTQPNTAPISPGS